MWPDSTYRELHLSIENGGPEVKFYNPPLDVQIAVQNAFIKGLEDTYRQVLVYYDDTNKVTKIAIVPRPH